MSEHEKSERARHFAGLRKLAVAVGVIGLALVAISTLNDRTRTSDPTDALPDGAFIVVTADVTRIRESPLYDAIFGEGTGRSLGLGTVEQACGFDPLSRVTRVAVVVPEAGERGEFGVAAQVNVKPEEIKTCAEKLAEARHDSGDGALKKQGDFYLLEGKGASLPRLAYRPDSGERGLLLVGQGSLVDQMMEAAQGKRARALSSPAHARLREALSKAPAPAVVLTAVLPESTRARIRNEMMQELDRGAPGSREIMAGVLAVDAAGAAIVAGESDGRAELRVEMTCERADACEAVKLLIEKKRLEWGTQLGVRLVAGPLLDALVVTTDGAHLSARTSSPSADAGRMIERVLQFRKQGRDRRADPLEPRDDRMRDPLAPRDDRMRDPLAPHDDRMRDPRPVSPQPDFSSRKQVRPDEVIRAKDAG